MATKYVVQKGDTLNDIAAKFGYKNYKEAGITSVPSGNFDLIRPGETISINDSNVPGYTDTTPVVSSLDSSQQFKTDSDKLDSLLNPPQDENADTVDGTEGLNKDKVTTDKETGLIKTGDALFDKLNEDAYYSKQDAEKQAEDVTKEYESLFSQELSAINERARVARNNIRASFAQRIDEQKRINKVNVDRVKAYGLSSGNAMLNPIEWSDAVTERERKGAEQIKSLEVERQNLIDAAIAARNEGRADLLEQKLKDVQSIEDRLNERLDEIQKESEQQYELLRKLREEQEAEFKQKQSEMIEKMRAYFSINSSEIENLTPEEKDAKVRELSQKYGLKYYEVFSVINEALSPDFAAEEAQLKNDKIRAEISATDALKGQRDASAASSWASAAKTNKETEQIGKDGNDDNKFTDTEKRKLEQAGLTDADRQTQLDFLYGDDIEKIDAKESAAAGGDLKTRADTAGYDYDAMRAAGYSDDDIKAALDAAGV